MFKRTVNKRLNPFNVIKFSQPLAWISFSTISISFINFLKSPLLISRFSLRNFNKYGKWPNSRRFQCFLSKIKNCWNDLIALIMSIKLLFETGWWSFKNGPVIAIGGLITRELYYLYICSSFSLIKKNIQIISQLN